MRSQKLLTTLRMPFFAFLRLFESPRFGFPLFDDEEKPSLTGHDVNVLQYVIPPLSLFCGKLPSPFPDLYSSFFLMRILDFLVV